MKERNSKICGKSKKKVKNAKENIAWFMVKFMSDSTK